MLGLAGEIKQILHDTFLAISLATSMRVSCSQSTTKPFSVALFVRGGWPTQGPLLSSVKLRPLDIAESKPGPLPAEERTNYEA